MGISLSFLCSRIKHLLVEQLLANNTVILTVITKPQWNKGHSHPANPGPGMFFMFSTRLPEGTAKAAAPPAPPDGKPRAQHLSRDGMGTVMSSYTKHHYKQDLSRVWRQTMPMISRGADANAQEACSGSVTEISS